MSNVDPVYTVSEASRVAGVSVATVRRRLEDGMTGAYREGNGPRASWRIPRQALVNGGLLAGEPTEEQALTSYDYERIIAAKEEVIDSLRSLIASQEHRLSLQSDLLACMERALEEAPSDYATVTELRNHV